MTRVDGERTVALIEDHVGQNQLGLNGQDVAQGGVIGELETGPVEQRHHDVFEGPGGPSGVVERAGQAAHLCIDDAIEQSLLAREVAVDGGPGAPRFAGDVLERGLGDAVLRDGGEGGVEDPRGGVVGLPPMGGRARGKSGRCH